MYHAALDTSLGISFAVASESQVILSEHLTLPARDSDQKMIPWLDELLRQQQLSWSNIRCWTVGTGPGSFAGLRFGIAFLQGICTVTGADLRGVPSSLALAGAAGGAPNSRLGVLHDARRGQVILTSYERLPGGMLKPRQEAVIISPQQLEQPEFACGLWTTAQAELLSILPASVAQATFLQPRIDAQQLLLATGGDASCEPVYVRPPVFVRPQAIRPI